MKESVSLSNDPLIGTSPCKKLIYLTVFILEATKR